MGTITMTLAKTTTSDCRRPCLSSDCRGCKTREPLDSPSSTSRTCWKEPDTALQQVLWASSDPNCPLALLSSPQAQLTHTHGSSLHPGQKTDQRRLGEGTLDLLDSSDTLDSLNSLDSLDSLNSLDSSDSLNSLNSFG